MKYKVGQKVKVVGNSWDYCGDYKSGEIIGINMDDSYNVRLEEVGVKVPGSLCVGEKLPFRERDLELVEPKGKPYTIKGKTYYAFPEGKTIKELGIDTSRKFIVVAKKETNGKYKNGDIVTLKEKYVDDGAIFLDEDGNTIDRFIRYSELSYYDEEETPLRVDGETRFGGSRLYGVSGAEQSLQIKANNLMPTGNKFMSNIVKFAKNMVLSADEKLLRKYGLKGECGEYSDEAREIVMDKLIHDNEQVLIDIAKAKEAEDKK